MPAPRVMNVNAPPFCLPLKPLDCNETTTLLRVKGALVGGRRKPDAGVGTIDLGLPAAATTCHMPDQMTRLGESRLASPASVVVRNLLEVFDQKGVPVVNAHVQQRPSNLVIVGWEVGQDEVTIRLNRVSCNALFEMTFKQRQMLVGQPVTQAWPLGKEGLLKRAGFTHVVPHMGTTMHSDTPEEATVVLIGVQGQNSTLVAQPIRKAPKTKEQRVTV